MRAYILCAAALAVLSGCEHLQDATARLYYRGFGTRGAAREIMRSYEGKMRNPAPPPPFVPAPAWLDRG